MNPRSLLVAAFVLLAVHSEVWAHARLVSSAPADGVVLDRPATEARLSFDSDVERRYARFSLARDGGPRRAIAAPSDGGTVREFRLSLGSLTPGRYVLRWSVVSRDGHRIGGAIRFTLRGQ
jgi:methionine-rich copper-binding protein CopC